MSLTWDCYTGHPSQVIVNLKRSITQLANNNALIKVGITIDPARRWREHQQSGLPWDSMHVVYRSTSLNYVRQLEKDLITHTIKRVESANWVGGGGGPNSDGAEHYLYFLVQIA